MSPLTRLINYVKSLKDLIPMSVICFKEGYSKEFFFNDLKAGISVGLIALPLSMAFAIGAGLSPQSGLYTAIIAGFFISLLGGSRTQIGGPTGAFIVIVYDTLQRHGVEGLALATLIAGFLMIVMGLARLGFFLKFIPYPVTVGFTSGIALTIFSSQIKDFFGLCMETPPSGFMAKWMAYIANFPSCNGASVGIGASTLILIFLIRHYKPKWPAVIISTCLATIFVTAFKIPVETIQTKFGGIPSALPNFAIPHFSLKTIQDVFPDAIAIALLGAIESLLSAVVADGMTGHRHRSNCELIAQGFANIASTLFGGIPATGAIARTTANINMGAKTPMAGMIHSFILLLFMLLLTPYAAKVPLPTLAAILIFVAWNMSEVPHFISIIKGARSDACVLVITFLLTVFIDLATAVQVGVILSAILFVKHMSDKTNIKMCQHILKDNMNEAPSIYDSDLILRKDIAEGTTIFEINGPFFFAVSDLLNQEWQQLPQKPKVFILRMRNVSFIDASGIKALQDFGAKCKRENVELLFSGLTEEIKACL